jgi:hypothetical protein
MANRSYLYASDLIPAAGIDLSRRRMIGISEWAYEIPWAFKQLVSVNPRRCVSSIWEGDEPIAVAGEYEPGVRRLLDFLDRLPRELVGPLADGARQFLLLAENRRQFFVLECGEIFEMEDDDLAVQADRLLKEIQQVNPPVSTSADAIYSLGVGNWSNVLYFDLNVGAS